MRLKSPEPLVLAIALGLLALGSAALAYTFSTLSQSDITGVSTAETKGGSSKKLKVEELTESAASWNSPVSWHEPADHHRLFHSVGYLFYPSLYPNGNYIQENNGSARSPGGVLLKWYQDRAIDFTSPTVDRDDPDNDGFSNMVEFKNEPFGTRLKAADCDGTKSTNPLDAQSHPDYLARLRLQKYESRPFHIQFKGYQQLNGIYEFQIVLRDIPSSSQPPLKKTGDPLGVEGYVVGDFHLNVVTRHNPKTNIDEQVDESTLELDKPEIGLKIPLVFKTETDSPESTADFVMLMPSEVDKVLKVPRGKILTVPFLPAGQSQFLVIEANDDGATIRDTTNQKDFHILKLDPAEWQEVPLPATAPPPKTP